MTETVECPDGNYPPLEDFPDYDRIDSASVRFPTETYEPPSHSDEREDD